MEYDLARDWKYSGGPADSPGAKVLPEGTVLGSIEIKDGVPMTPQMLADALQRNLARECSKPAPPAAKTMQEHTSRLKKAKRKVLDE